MTGFEHAPGVGDEVPEPPRGPGVTPPFPAPPTDRSRKSLWIGLGIGSIVLVLCCVGGIVGLGALVISTTNEFKADATEVTTQYLDALVARDYDGAYALLCSAITQRQTRAEFAAARRDAAHPRSYELEEPIVGDTSVTVPAYVRYDDGQERAERYRLVFEETAGPLRMCGTTG